LGKLVLFLLKNWDGKSEKYRKVEYVQRHVCFVNVQSSLQENVVFTFCARMDNILYLSCEIPFPVKTPVIISGLTSVVVWLSREEVIKKKSGNFLRR